MKLLIHSLLCEQPEDPVRNEAQSVCVCACVCACDCKELCMRYVCVTVCECDGASKRSRIDLAPLRVSATFERVTAVLAVRKWPVQRCKEASIATFETPS